MAGKVSVIGKEWLPLEDAMQQLGKSAKTIERLVNAGQLRSRLEAREGRKPQRLYHSGDLERIKEESIPAPASEPRRALVPAKTTQNAIPTNVVTEFVTKWLDRRQQAVSLTEKLWLTLDEAGQYSGLSRSDLLGLCRSGALVARKSGGWRIRRASLEAFEG